MVAGDLGFPHEKLDVYRAAVEFVSLSAGIIANLPRGHAYLADQLARAAASIVLNTAEGCGRYVRRDKARFLRIALGSAAEAAAILDVAAALGAASASEVARGKALLNRIGAMLTALCRRQAHDHDLDSDADSESRSR